MTATLEPRGMQLFDEFTSLLDRADDPLGFEAGDANLYRYVGNSPPNGVDPTGLQFGGNIYWPAPPERDQPNDNNRQHGAMPPSGVPFGEFCPENLRTKMKPDLDWYKDKANKINDRYRENIKNTDKPEIKQRYRNDIERQNQRIRDIDKEMIRRTPGPKVGPPVEPPIPWWRIPLPIWLWPPLDWLHPDPRNPPIA